MGYDRRSHTTGKSMEQMLNRIGSVILSGQNRRFIRVHFKILLVFLLAFSAIKIGNLRAIVISPNPFVPGLELAFAEFRISILSFISRAFLISIRNASQELESISWLPTILSTSFFK
jgi:hypothetical protein